jgi:serine/threonine-protein kinase
MPRLFVRSLDRGEAAPLAGTEGASTPFFSPDGAWIGFLVENTIRKIPAAGGPAAVVGGLPGSRHWGESWAEDGTIFAAAESGILRVPAAGGTPAPVTTPDASKGERHLLPQPLPGGNFLLYTSVESEEWNTSRIVLRAIDGGEPRVLVPGADGRYVATGDAGHLVYLNAGTLMAVPFDPRSQQIGGEPVPILDAVMQGLNAPNGADETGAGQFAVSAAGTLVYITGGIGPTRERSLVWVDRQGKPQPLGTWAGPYMSPRLSPDGQRIAVASRRGASRTTDIWVYDIARDAPTRLTFDANNNSPVWSPDGTRIVYAAGPLHTIAVNGGSPERLLSSSGLQVPTSWSAGANAIVFLQRPDTKDMASGIWVAPMNGAAAGQPRLFVQSRFSLTHPDLSPDGRWIAYASTESGARDVYVQAYPGPGEKIRISRNGGTEPIWTDKGRELLYRAQTASGMAFMSVRVRSTTPFRTDPPRVLFETKFGEYDSTGPSRGWDATPDGQRFLLGKPSSVDEPPVTALRVVLNWSARLEQLVPRK